MADGGPVIALQSALVAALKANTGVAALVSARIYDAVPDKVALPYISLGEMQAIDDGADCLDEAVEIYATLHVWSRAVGAVECRRINAAIKKAVHHAPLALGSDWSLVDIRVHDDRSYLDADGKTSHGIVTLRAFVDPAN